MAYKNNRKQIISRQRVIKNLKGDNIPMLLWGIGVLILSLMIILPVIIGFMGEYIDILSRMLESMLNFVMGLFITLGMLIFVALIVLPFVVIADACMKLSRINSGRFVVEVDKVAVKTIETKRRVRGRYVTYVDERVIYFEKFGRFVVSEDIYEDESLDSTFYVVAYDSKKPKALYAYNTAVYEYAEREIEEY